MARRGRKAGYPTGERSFWEPDYSEGKNGDLFRYHYWRLVELTCSMFDWKGLPDSVDVRYLELALFTHGMAVFFEDEVMGLLATKVTAAGPFDIYGYPVQRQAFADNGYIRMLTPDDSVIVWNNYLRKPTTPDAYLFASRMADMDAAVDVNVKAQKTPVLITCPEQQRQSMKTLYDQYEGNKPVIFGEAHLDAKSSVSVLSTEAPYVADKIYELRTMLNNEYLTRVGISNMNIGKKERMLSEEVQRNMGATVASRYSPLDMRKKALEEVNRRYGEKYGFEATVEYKSDYLDVGTPYDGDGVDAEAEVQE